MVTGAHRGSNEGNTLMAWDPSDDCFFSHIIINIGNFECQ